MIARCTALSRSAGVLAVLWTGHLPGCDPRQGIALWGFPCALYPIGYIHSQVALLFPRGSLERLREFPRDVQQDAGYQLELVQAGRQPEDFKPMPSIGRGVEEIRVRDDSGVYRVIYTARVADAVYVLHAFQKKTQATPKRDLDLARERFQQLMERRK